MREVARESQDWFWSEEWQAAEREAEADLAGGRMSEFENMEDAILFLGFYRGEGSGQERHSRTEGS